MADKMMKKDLLLESTGKWGEKVQAILPNIPSQRYVFGSVYPGAREGEEFVFGRQYQGGPIAPTHCVISVDERGQYWIEDCTDQSNGKTTFKTLVNMEKVKAGEQRLLKSGNSVSFWGPETPLKAGSPCQVFHVYNVKERIIPSPVLQSDENVMNEILEDPDSPLANELILEEIMSYLRVKDLKNARLVSKMWKVEASKYLEKRGAVSFSFTDFENSENSTRVFRYFHEMRDLKIQTLHVFIVPKDACRRGPHYFVYAEYNNQLLLSPGEPGEKVMDDLRKLLKSPHNFSSLFLKCEGANKLEFSPAHLLLQELGGKLVELNLDLNIQFPFPSVLPPLPFPVMTNLKKLTHSGYLKDNHFEQRWVSQFAPLLPKGLEHLTCSNNLAELYLQELLKQGATNNLKEIGRKGRRMYSPKHIQLLLELESTLTSFQVDANSAADYQLVERLLWKHAKSLQHLQIHIGTFVKEINIMEIKFPPFPKLTGLVLTYLSRTKVSWETDLDYGEQFPSLRKLTVYYGGLRGRPEDDLVSNAFFPEEREVRCETVRDLRVPDLQAGLNEAIFQQRMDRIKGIFPNAVKTDFS